MRTIIVWLMLVLTVESVVINNGDTLSLTKKYNKNQGDIIINGGTLLIGGNNLINDGVNISLNGGTIDTSGYRDVVGGLTLSANSTIDLGTGTSILTFASLNYTGGSLIINNWTGNLNGSGTDRLIFSNITGVSQSFLNNVYFNGYGFGAHLVGNELVAIPEADTYIAGVLLLLVILFIERKRIYEKIHFSSRD